MLRGGSSAAAFWDELRIARSSGKKGIKEECVLKQIEARVERASDRGPVAA